MSLSLRYGTRAYLRCKDGFKTKSNQVYYFECSEHSIWSGTQIECEGKFLLTQNKNRNWFTHKKNQIAITCGNPPVLNEILFNSKKNHYAYGAKLQLKCNEGYELIGEPFVQCLSNGVSILKINFTLLY